MDEADELLKECPENRIFTEFIEWLRTLTPLLDCDLAKTNKCLAEENTALPKAEPLLGLISAIDHGRGALGAGVRQV
jgi:hypothetical protein